MPQPLSNDPRDLLIGEDNDLVITTDLQWSRGIDAVVQSCRIALQMFAGEWFLDLNAGISYWEGILGAKPSEGVALARVEFTRELLAVEGVLEILKLDVKYLASTRKLNIVWQVRTGLGDTPINSIDVGGAS